ncbi:MAG: hypothetical protein B6242_00850 [Anaerolineaceae bacterium 4572_78]|nr:MAG: hypothetical protein B6242_00850 [Anaerolineaceae bacterium 4572_78]
MFRTLKSSFNHRITHLIFILVGIVISITSLLIDVFKTGSLLGIAIGWNQWLGAFLGIVFILVGIKPMLIQEKHISTVLAFCLGICWLIFIYILGIGFTSDTVGYLTYAVLMHDSLQLATDPVWPPLYPFLINIFMFLNEFPAEATALLSGTTMVLLLIIFALVLQEFSDDSWLCILFVAILFTFPPFLSVFRVGFSESLFSLFFILSTYFLIKHYKTTKKRYYTYVVLFVALTVLTRYIGYVLIAAFLGYTIYFLFIRHHTNNISIRSYLFLHSLTYIPISLYLIRNYVISQTLHGFRLKSELSVWGNIYTLLNVFANDMGYYLLIILSISILIYLFHLRTSDETIQNRLIKPLSFILGVILVYCAVLIYSFLQQMWLIVSIPVLLLQHILIYFL